MILLWGAPGDPPLDAVQEALSRRGGAALLLDQRRASETAVRLCVGAHGRVSGDIEDADGTVPLDCIHALYLRPVETAKACGTDAPGDPVYRRAAATDAAMVTWADAADAAVVNRPAAMAANNAKPYQLALIAGWGFAVPDTLVTTDIAALRAFHARHGSVIYKSVSGVRSIVSRLATLDDGALRSLGNCPTQFQQYIPGTDVRVHVVGDTILATEIRSAADDYRYASRVGADVAMVPLDLPQDVATACRAMAIDMGLLVAGIDLRRTPDGAWYCFEVNPSPGFTFFEAGTGQPIAAAVADLLLRCDRAGDQPRSPSSGTCSARAARASGPSSVPSGTEARCASSR